LFPGLQDEEVLVAFGQMGGGGQPDRSGADHHDRQPVERPLLDAAAAGVGLGLLDGGTGVYGLLGVGAARADTAAAACAGGGVWGGCWLRSSGFVVHDDSFVGSVLGVGRRGMLSEAGAVGGRRPEAGGCGRAGWGRANLAAGLAKRHSRAGAGGWP